MADTSIFDMEALMETTCGDRALASQVLDIFLADIPAQIAELEGALTAGDKQTAERAAHSIKGASATVGAEQLRSIAEECEGLGRAGNLEALGDRMRLLRERYAVLEQMLRRCGLVEA